MISRYSSRINRGNVLILGVGKKMKEKGIAIMVVVITALVMLCGNTLAAAADTPVTDAMLKWLKIDGDIFEDGEDLVVERGDTLEIKVKLKADYDVEDIEVEAHILGYEYNDHVRISDSSHIFDLEANETVYKTLKLTIPSNLEKDEDDGEYDLRVRIGGRRGEAVERQFRLSVDGPRHGLTIKDLVFSPEGEVKAGRALLSTVRIENVGENEEESLKVRVSIPALGVSASDYLDELDEDESTTSEELYLRIPSCTEPGLYTVKAEVIYDDGYEKATKESTIRVVEDESCYAAPETGSDSDKPEKTIISVGTTNLDVALGEGGVVYPITISNSGSQSKVYTLNVDGLTGWAESKITPSNTVVLAAGETKSIYVYITAVEGAAAGEHMFSVEVSSDGSVLKNIPLKSNVVSGEAGTGVEGWEKVKRGLEVGLIVLVVLLVLLGLIVGFNKLKGGREEDDQTYY